MQEFWSLLIKLIMEYLSKWLNPIDPELTPRFGAALEAAAAKMPAPKVEDFGEAPDDLKVLVRKLLTDLIEKNFTSRPIIRSILTTFVRNLPDALIDSLWDSIFKAGLVKSPAFEGKPTVRASGRGASDPNVNPVASGLSSAIAAELDQ
jgi:hypothetical protein